MLASTALVLMMTIPGLALFYGGMVRKKNILTIVMQCFATTCIITVVWMLVGYSLAFTDGGGLQKYIGGTSQFLLKSLTLDSAHSLAGTIPESVFMTFQMTFAIITPALIVGAFADRMKFSALVLFMILWGIVVYAPIAHWVWGGGFLGGAGVLDYRRRHRGAYQRRYRGPGYGPLSRQAHRLRHREHGAVKSRL